MYVLHTILFHNANDNLSIDPDITSLASVNYAIAIAFPLSTPHPFPGATPPPSLGTSIKRSRAPEAKGAQQRHTSGLVSKLGLAHSLLRLAPAALVRRCPRQLPSGFMLGTM